MSESSLANAQSRSSREYNRRIDRVIDYLRKNLHRATKLSELARIACFSEFHFHRIFSAVTGETLNDFSNRLRVEKAARLLRYGAQSLTSIALECGFSSSATFSRSFRSFYSASPSQFRKNGIINESKICKDLFSADEYILDMTDEEKATEFPVRLVELPIRHVVYVRVTNAYQSERVISALEAIVSWARTRDILSQGTLFGMSIDDPHVTPKRLYRYEVCFDCPSSVDHLGMSTMTMPAMRYAVTTVSGDIKKVATAWDYLFRGWLTNSDYQPEHAPALEIFRDKEKAIDWSHFELDLCLPVRAL